LPPSLAPDTNPNRSKVAVEPDRFSSTPPAQKHLRNTKGLLVCERAQEEKRNGHNGSYRKGGRALCAKESSSMELKHTVFFFVFFFFFFFFNNNNNNPTSLLLRLLRFFCLCEKTSENSSKNPPAQ
jgi:hypothetical protein